MPFRPRKKASKQKKRQSCKRCGSVMHKRAVRCKKCSESLR